MSQREHTDQAEPKSAREFPGQADERRRRALGYLRHELRTSLGAVIGYSEHLLEELHAAGSSDMADPLHQLKRTGDAIFVAVRERLAPEALSELGGDALPRVMDELRTICLELLRPLNGAALHLIGIAEREARYPVIPILCRIQAAAVMLGTLLNSYSLDAASKGLWADRGDQPDHRADDAGSGIPQRGARLLVADDSSVSRDVLRQWLERDGHVVDEATGGEFALELLRKNDYDLVFLDLRMPDTDGTRVLETLKREGRLGLAPIIIVSASDDAEGVTSCIRLGADDYVFKPFNMALLRARIRSCLELKHLRQHERAYQELLTRHGNPSVA